MKNVKRKGVFGRWREKEGGKEKSGSKKNRLEIDRRSSRKWDV